MRRFWITNGSTKVGPIVNALAAACHDGYVPTDVYLLDNPTIHDVSEAATAMIETIVTANGGDEPTVTVETIDDERDFEAIVAYLKSSIGDGNGDDAEVAVDVTPGRKFWPIISFQAGIEYGADHLYYVHMDGSYYGESYPTIPRTAIDLVDFTEVL